MKKVTSLKDGEYIHCETVEENLAIRELMHKAGLKWANGDFYIPCDYQCTKNPNIYFSPKIWYWYNRSELNCWKDKIHPASDFINPSIKPVVKRPKYEWYAINDQWNKFEKNAIWDRTLEEIKKQIQERKDSIKRDESLLRSHRSLFSKKR